MQHGKVILTNLPWEVSEKKLQDLLKTPQVSLMNDFTASAYGTKHLPKKDYITLGSLEVKRDFTYVSDACNAYLSILNSPKFFGEVVGDIIVKSSHLKSINFHFLYLNT